MKKVLILADTPGWIVDKITDEMVARMPFQFIKAYYTQISTDQILQADVDLVHYQNWDLERHLPDLFALKTPLLISCRSHRYPDYFPEVAQACNVHVCSPYLLKSFPKATYIPDGVDDRFAPQHTFTVGFVGRPDEYKGYPLIVQACKELGVKFRPALDIKPEYMPDYYNSVDVVVVASENEGFNTIAMECFAMNVPVITTYSGVPKLFDCIFATRSVEGIKKKIGLLYTQDRIKDYRWDVVCNQFTKLYDEIIARGRVSENSRVHKC